ncbi:hypothetical protein QBC38DRAFT_512662 [Podospora fimiseda]|uniref:protein-ribulosamine 3-kinase n=1 Tax=Podospora fimiseda TaxID=252190 RepID=A0AAN6YPK9_9PEZI|nr:hypothetical protein QBC38DRAFT_512662 [Podospora fimiseda]
MSGETATLIANKLAELALPANCEIISVSPSGASAWVQTVRIECLLEDGTIKNYFRKASTRFQYSLFYLTSGEDGRRMMEGSFESESAFHTFSPNHVPKPIAFGNYDDDPATCFYLCESHDMMDEVPDPANFVPIIVGIHKASMGKSPNGQYGFHSSWEAWFTQAMRQMFEIEEKAHGKDEHLEELKKSLYDKVIPPDLWPGNTMTDMDTGEVILFDSCAFWGHSEADLGTWRAARYKMGRPFFAEYYKSMNLSEPKEGWDARNA